MNKKALVAMIHHAANLKLDTQDASIAFKDQKMIFLTAAGQIIGTPMQKDDEKPEDIKEQILDTLFFETGKTYSDTSNETDFILLKNAVLTTAAGNQISYAYLYLFTDDIIAATFGAPNIN